MAVNVDDYFYSDGTATFTPGSDIVTGVGTVWDMALATGDYLFPYSGGLIGAPAIVKNIPAYNQIQLAKPWPGAQLTGVFYLALRGVLHTDPRIYGYRASAFLAKLANVPDNLADFLSNLNAAVAANQQAAATAVDAKNGAVSAQGAAAASATSAANSNSVVQTTAATVAANASLVQALVGIMGDYGDQETSGSSATGDFGDQT